DRLTAPAYKALFDLLNVILQVEVLFAYIDAKLWMAQDVACHLSLRVVKANDKTLDRLQLLEEAATRHHIATFNQQRPQVGPSQAAMSTGEDREDCVNACGVNRL